MAANQLFKSSDLIFVVVIEAIDIDVGCICKAVVAYQMLNGIWPKTCQWVLTFNAMLGEIMSALDQKLHIHQLF